MEQHEKEKWYTVLIYGTRWSKKCGYIRTGIYGAFTSLEAFEQSGWRPKEFEIEYHSGKTAKHIMLDEGLSDFNLIKHD